MKFVTRIEFADGKAFTVELIIDEERLASQMAVRARGNKHKRAVILKGAIITNVREEKAGGTK